MAEHAAARLIEDQLAQCVVFSNVIALIPKGFAGRRRNAAHDDVADLAFGVAADDMDGFCASHDPTLRRGGRKWKDRLAIVMVEAYLLPMRIFWLGFGWLCVGLGAVGAFLPLLPTVPFLLLAAFCFARSSEKVHKWLIEHPKFGPPIADWRRNGAIRRRVKWISTASIIVSFAIPALMGVKPMILAIQAVALICVSVFIWTRPEG